MEKRTVKRRIFISNACMVIITLAIFLVLNIFVIKIYLKTAENELRTSVEQFMDPLELLSESARTQMIAGISHDLRTPLTAVKGTVKGFMDGIASTKEQQNQFLQIAYRRTEDMEGLLNELFYLSKIETGNMPKASF